MNPVNIYGIDFSGARDAGRKIWIAAGVVDSGVLKINQCQQARNLEYSGSRPDQAIPALRSFLLKNAPCAVGLDFPFGLPAAVVDDDCWEDFVDTFSAQYHDPEFFKESCTQTALNRTGRKELRRETDVLAQTPFSPWNLRLYRQTFWGIQLIGELVRSGKVSVLPMQPAEPDRVWLLEICPASTLKQMGLSQSYKKPEFGDVRAFILNELEQREGVLVPESVRRLVVSDGEGDALDSVIAAVATYRAMNSSIDQCSVGTPQSKEGFVFV